jgi:hypothetical protein
LAELTRTRIYAGSINEGFEKAKKYFKKEMHELEYKLISSNGEGDKKYLLEFSLKSSQDGRKGRLFDDVFLDDFDVLISKDKMKAYILIPPHPKQVDRDYIFELLKENGVVKGIMEDRVDLLIHLLDSKSSKIEPTFLVAEGKKAVDGYNAEVLIKSDEKKEDEFLVEESLDRVDYKNIKKNRLGVVYKDSAVAYYNPPTKGQPGFTVTGEILEANDGVDLIVKLNENVVKRDNVYYSLIDGLLEYNFFGNIVEMKITNVYIVKGNVDYKTGNIEFPGSVIISGELQAGFSVKSGENIIAKAISGEAHAKGNIIVKEGIIGSSHAKRCKIRAGGMIEATFIQFADVATNEGVVVKNLIRDSMIITDGKITCFGKPGNIYGGVFYATKGVEANILGSASFVKTKIVVGASAKYVSRLSKLMQDKEHLERTLQQILNFLGSIEKRMDTLDEEKKRRIAKLVDEKRKVRRNLYHIYASIDEIKLKLKEGTDTEILFHKEAMPGVVAVIGEYFFELNKLEKNGKFVFDPEKKEVVIEKIK